MTSIGILSMGEMGTGVANLLRFRGYHVMTNVNDRSERTKSRALLSGIETVPNDEELAQRSDYVLSIVPPRDALATAKRICAALESAKSRETPLYYLDLNAISPRSAREIASLFSNLEAQGSLRFVDGGIIGGPPELQGQSLGGETKNEDSRPALHDWYRPSIVLSGPYDISQRDAHLYETLNAEHVGPNTGAASGLKCCFASMTKGMTAIAVQAYVTAHRLGVLKQLQEQQRLHAPQHGQIGTKGAVGCPPKAYRWIKEMEEISITFAEDGGFECDTTAGDSGSLMFQGAAEVFKLLSENTDLGLEQAGKRKRGTTIEDLVEVASEGIVRSKKKKD